MTAAAAEVYDIDITATSKRKRALGWLGVLFTNLISMGDGTANPGGRIISIRDRATGEEVSRHIESYGDDEAAVLAEIRSDLESKTAADFAEIWITN